MTSLVLIYVFAAVVAIIGLISKTPLRFVIKGWFGELLVKLTVRFFLNKDYYRVFHNVLIYDDEGGTTQIDHIVLAKTGIFVIETKNIRGWIFGGEKSKVWTQTLYRKKSSFQNPLRQNYKHIACLSKTIKCPIEAFHNVVTFTGEATFKTPETLPPSVAKNGYALVQYIKSVKEEILDDESLQEIAHRIESYRLESTYRNARHHVAYLKEKHKK